MADTIIGTTGIFFTLALIALLSFLVGLVLYTLSDYLRQVFCQRNRAARRRAHGGQGTGPQGSLGDAVVRAALHAADAWIQHARRDGASERTRWTAAAEFAAAMLAAVEHGARGGATAAGHGVAERDACAGGLYRVRPADMSGDLHRFLDERVARYRTTQAAATAGRGVTLSGAALAVLARNVAEAMGQPAYGPAEQGRLAEVLTDVMTLDLDQAMGSV